MRDLLELWQTRTEMQSPRHAGALERLRARLEKFKFGAALDEVTICIAALQDDVVEFRKAHGSKHDPSRADMLAIAKHATALRGIFRRLPFHVVRSLLSELPDDHLMRRGWTTDWEDFLGPEEEALQLRMDRYYGSDEATADLESLLGALAKRPEELLRDLKRYKPKRDPAIMHFLLQLFDIWLGAKGYTRLSREQAALVAGDMRTQNSGKKTTSDAAVLSLMEVKVPVGEFGRFKQLVHECLGGAPVGFAVTSLETALSELQRGLPRRVTKRHATARRPGRPRRSSSSAAE